MVKPNFFTKFAPKIGEIGYVSTHIEQNAAPKRYGYYLFKSIYMEGLTYMETAVLLMIIGMGTVFVILILIINLSKLMIMAVNKFAPEEEVAAKKTASAPAAIPANVEAAIKAAIAQVAPKAMVTKITK